MATSTAFAILMVVPMAATAFTLFMVPMATAAMLSIITMSMATTAASVTVLMIVTATAIFMHMAMADFLIRCIPTTHDFHLKLQSFTGHLMIGIHGHRIPIDRQYRNQTMTAAHLRLKTHPTHQRIFEAELASRHFTHQSLIQLAIGILRLEGHVHLPADFLADQCSFQPGNHRFNSHQKQEGILLAGFFD